MLKTSQCELIFKNFQGKVTDYFIVDMEDKFVATGVEFWVRNY